MSYIIENASLLKNDRISKTSLLISKNRIEFMKSSMSNIRFMKMDMSSYVLTPGYVMLDFSLQSSFQFHDYKRFMVKQYIQKGCTSLLTVVNIQEEHEFSTKIKQRRQLMINSPIDYYIGVKVPFKTLTPTFLRKCKRFNISVVFIEFNPHDNLHEKSWGWIRDAMFSNPITLIPFMKEESIVPLKRQKMLTVWEKIMKEHRLSSITSYLNEGVPLSKDVLMRIGIYPVKGDLHVGGQVNYNLYHLNDIDVLSNGTPILSPLPLITVHQGRLINVDGNVTYVPGTGEECYISIPGRFIPQSVTI